MSPDTDSRHFTLTRITDGVYAAIHRDGGRHICNTGVVDLGDRTLVYDTGLSPLAAEDLRSAVVRLTGGPPSVVVNSHWHNDHVRGNQVFPEATVVSSSATRALVASEGASSMESDYGFAQGRIEEVRAALESGDEAERQFAENFVGYLEGIMESYAVLRLRPADIAFEGRMEVHGSTRSATLIEYKNGHSQSDCVLHLPAEGVLFCGDLCYVGYHPCLDLGDPRSLLKILDELGNLKPVHVVPGHGVPGKATAFEAMKRYIHALTVKVSNYKNRGGTLDKIGSVTLPPELRGLGMKEFFYERNLRALYRMLP